MSRKLFQTLVLLFASLALLGSAHALNVSEITDVTPKVDEPPSPFKSAPPVYPVELRKQKVGGIVSVVVVIDESGAVIAAEVSKTSNEEFNGPALDAIRSWKFKPARLAGKAVKVRVTIPVRFSAE